MSDKCMSFRLALISACVVAMPATAEARQPAPAADSNPVAPHPHAMAIARLLLPLDAAVEAGIRIGKRAFHEMFRSNAEVAELERDYPGIAAALWPALEPELRAATIEDHPPYLNMIASFYSSHFTPAELEALHTFYATPTGRKIIGGLYRDGEFSAMLTETVQSPDAPVSQAAADETMRDEARRLIATLTAEDEAPIRAALRVIPEAKLARANAELSRLVVEWLNRPTPELDARLDVIMAKTMDRYIAEHPRKD